MSRKLKPCPFCGDEPEFLESDAYDEDFQVVQCETCCFELMSGPIGLGWFATKDEAADAWNTRFDA